ncbi:hypothetical protein CC2G_004215 [Coprinopsis cinerea AmutBmut pab1-1]|nr:hypothetical protein CC2G_004215 [Coprinopsis cinerea AmutBmut pab1-1]
MSHPPESNTPVAHEPDRTQRPDTPSLTSLPPEILAYILEQLDREFMPSTSLVHSKLREPSQRHFFSRLTLSPSGPGTNTGQTRYAPGKALLELFNSNPIIAGYPTAIAIAQYRKGWLSEDPMIADALNCLSINRIKSFSYVVQSSPGRLESVDDLTELPPATQAAIVKICSSPSLESLSLWNAPISMVRAAGRSVRKLFLPQIRFPEPSDLGHDVAAPRSSPVNIVDLRVKEGRSIDWLLDISNGFAFSDLRHLSCDAGAASQIMRLLRMCEHSLETIAIAFGLILAPSPSDPTIDLCRLSNLRTLEVRFGSTDFTIGEAIDPLARVIDILHTLPPSSSLETLCIVNYFSYTKLEMVNFPSWPLLDNLPLDRSPPRFPHLKTVEIELNCVHSANKPQLGLIAGMIRGMIPKLVDSGIVTIGTSL